VIDTIKVTPLVKPVTENGTVASTGGIAIANVLTNDSTNGAPSTLVNSSVAQSGVWPAGITLNPLTGAINVAGGTPPGNYPVTYQLCDRLTPVTCATVVDTIKVTPVVKPVTENGTVSSFGGIAIANVLSNDSTNGVPSTLVNSTVAQSGTWPAGITLNPTTGAISVATGTPIGNYPVTYQLCDKLTPAACDTVVDTIKVTPKVKPVTENGTAPATGGIAIANVLSNDSTNGVPSTLANSSVSQSGIWPVGISLNPATGEVSVAPGTPPGNYPVRYQLCDLLSPATCDSVVDTVKVTPVIKPVTENGTVTSYGGIAIADVLLNDSTNGAMSTLANSTVSQSGVWPTGITLNPLTGAINVARGTPPANYPVTYELCDKLTPKTCATMVDTIKVTSFIKPAGEKGSVTANGGTPIVNVLLNDSTNGLQSTFTNSKISQVGTWPTGISLNTANGSITVEKGVTPGTYLVTYKLCDTVTPVSVCEDQVDTVIVTPFLKPITENGTAPATGGIAIVNVLTNDSTNGVPSTFINSSIAQSGPWPIGITLDTNTGAVIVATGTTPGKYPVTYQLCDRLNPLTCSIVVDTITVTPSINPVTESGTVSSFGGIAIANVLSNDSTNGVPSTLANSTIAQSGTWPAGITLDPSTGAINVATGTPPGIYSVYYLLCDKLSPITCALMEDFVIVTPNIRPTTESGKVSTLVGGIAIPNILTNDSTNGVPSTLANSTISQIGIWPTGISLNPATGAVTVVPGTPPGAYTVTYQVCDKLTPKTCATMAITVVVDGLLNPKPDTGIVWLNKDGIAIPDITVNDSVNGAPVRLGAGGNATVSQVGIWPTGIVLDPLTGQVTVTKNTPVGIYRLPYVLCDTLNPRNCKETTIVITVVNTKPDTVTAEFKNSFDKVICPTLDDLALLTGTKTFTTPASIKGFKVVGPDANGCYTFTWDSTEFSLEPVITFISTCINGVCDTTYIVLNPPFNLTIPNYFSPNGDGQNDYFVLPYQLTSKYPKLKFMVYNRWGNIVYRSNGTYQNDWNAIHQPDGLDLPDGVYYYMLELDPEFGTTITGFIEIMRQ
jgi:gliding motility-associated-like protein